MGFNSDKSFRIEVRIAWIDVAQSRMRELLGEKLFRAWSTQVSNPFDLAWFRPPTSEQSKIFSALQQNYAADRVVIELRDQFFFLGLKLDYTQTLRYQKINQLEVIPRIEVVSLGRKWIIETYRQALLFRLGLILSLTFLYGIAFLIALYGLSVFLLFQELPAEVFVYINERPLAAMSFLAFLVGLAGIMGRVFVALYQWFISRGRGTKSL